ncbi:MAG: substrate-binding domain-containing protein, partial [Coriobacteriia bacterium]
MHPRASAPSLRRTAALTLGVMLVLSLAGCGDAQDAVDGTGSKPAKRSEVILSSTTSTEDSGLFGVLIPAFEEANPEYAVKVIAVGTGEALENGRNKDADVLLVHAKADEEQFVDDGFGVIR